MSLTAALFLSRGLWKSPPLEQTGVVKKKIIKKPRNLYYLQTIVTNLGDAEGRRYVRVKIILEYENWKLGTEIRRIESQIYNNMFEILQDLTSDQFNTEKGKLKFKQKLKSKINKLLTKGQVENIYFKEIVVI